MTPQETSSLLRYAATLDRWLRETDPEAGQMMVAGWTSMLAEVPVEFAQRAVRDHYAEPEARTLTPGDVLSAWREDVRRAKAREDVRARREDRPQPVEARSAAEIAGALPINVGSAGEYMAAMQAAIARGEDPSTVTRPAGVRVLMLSPTAEARERQCRFPDVCVCTHLECRDGWLDLEGEVTNALGKRYVAVTRCPRCEEGSQMAGERGLYKKPRRTSSYSR